MFHDFHSLLLSFCCIHHFSFDNLSQHQTRNKQPKRNSGENIYFVGIIKQLSYHQVVYMNILASIQCFITFICIHSQTTTTTTFIGNIIYTTNTNNKTFNDINFTFQHKRWIKFSLKTSRIFFIF